MNYSIRPYWDKNMAIVFTLGNVSDINLVGLAYKGVMTITGAPDTVAHKWMKGATVQNEVDGTFYLMTGTPASPAWTQITGGGGSGITALTGDVTASGSGSVAATIANLAVTTAKIADAAITTAKIANNSVDGTKIAIGSQTTGSIMYYNGTDWIVLPIGTAGQVLTVNGGATAPSWA